MIAHCLLVLLGLSNISIGDTSSPALRRSARTLRLPIAAFNTRIVRSTTGGLLQSFSLGRPAHNAPPTQIAGLPDAARGNRVVRASAASSTNEGDGRVEGDGEGRAAEVRAEPAPSIISLAVSTIGSGSTYRSRTCNLVHRFSTSAVPIARRKARHRVRRGQCPRNTAREGRTPDGRLEGMP